MSTAWSNWWNTRSRIQIGITAIGVGLLLAAISLPRMSRVSNNQLAMRETGLAEYAGPPAPPPPPPLKDRAALLRASAALESESSAGSQADLTDTSSTGDRKIVATSALSLTVTNPAETAQKIRHFAEGLGGYVESAQVNSSSDTPSATITIRVPASHLEDAKADLRKLAVHVESETTDAKDVTREYVDMEARMRTLRAEEAQYLVIMKSASKVKDMLEVSEKLSEVRGEIERQQAEFAALSKQVETVAISVSLNAQVDTAVFGMTWRPLYQVKVALRDAMEGLANYASTMVAVLLYLPVILLWGATFLFGLIIAWRVVRWAGSKFELFKPVAKTT